LNNNILNNNNNVVDSVVLPPRMKDLQLWCTTHNDFFEDSGVQKKWYDLSGKGNHMTMTDSDHFPSFGVTAGQFAGKKVMKLTHDAGGRNETYVKNTDIDLEDIFGNAAASVADPEWTLVMVLNETSGSAGTEKYLSIQGSGGQNDKIFLMRHDNGAAFRINGNANDFDTSQIDFTQGTAVTSFNVCTDVGSDMTFEQWIGGVACDWDDSGVGTQYSVDPNTMFDAVGETVTLTIGAEMDESDPWYGEIAEILMWKGAHTTAERTETLNYLQDKWDCS